MLSGIYKNTKSLSGINQTTLDIANLYSTTANLYGSNVFTDVANLKASNITINSKLANLISSNLITTGLINDLSNANVQSNIQITNLLNGNVQSNIRITTLEDKTANITRTNNLTYINGELQSLSVFTASSNIIMSGTTTNGFLQTKHIVAKTGNLNANSSVYMLGNLFSNTLNGGDAFNAIQDLQNANLNIQAGNLNAHTRITTLETKTQLLTSNATVSILSGNLTVRGNIDLNNSIRGMANIYSTTTPQLNFIGDGGVGQEYYGTLQFCSGDGASRATISSSLVSGNLSLSYGLALSGWRVRQSGTDLLTVNTANTWVQGNLTVNANISGYGNQHFLSGNTTVQGNLIVGNINCTSTQSFFLGNVGIGTTNAFGKLQVVGLSNIIGDQTVSGSIGIGTTSALSNIHIENGKPVGLNPDLGHLYVYNNNSSSTSAHAIACLRTNGGSSGNPCLSFDINGVSGFSLFIDNSDSDSLKIKNAWNMNASSFYDCLKIGTDRKFFIYGEPSIRCRFHAIGSYAGSYTAGNNINFSYTIQDIAGTSSQNSGVLTLCSGYAGYYIISCSGRFTDGTATNGLYLYAGANNLFGTSDGVYWGTQDPSNRRCFSYTTTRYLSSSTQVRAQMYAGTTFDLILISVLYIGIQS